MGNIYRPGHKYIFTKKKFIQQYKRQGYDWRLCRGWVNECNGRQVEIYNITIGFIAGYTINPHWCKEVK